MRSVRYAQTMDGGTRRERHRALRIMTLSSCSLVVDPAGRLGQRRGHRLVRCVGSLEVSPSARSISWASGGAMPRGLRRPGLHTSPGMS